ncbi:MAG: hypothetical protein ACLFSR_01785 [Halomonas sp.]
MDQPQIAPDKNQASQSITIDGVEYQLSELTEEARAQVINLRVTDQEIAKLKQQLAIYQTARAAYARTLSEKLPTKQAH